MKSTFILIIICINFAGYSQQMVDFKHIKAVLEPVSDAKMVKGDIQVTFKVLAPIDSLFLDAKNFTITDQSLEGTQVHGSSDKIWFEGPFEEGREYHAYFSYEAFPKQAIYFTNEQIWTQGQGKYTSHYLPSLDVMTDKIEFDLSIVIPSEKTAIANGNLIDITDYNGKKRWNFDMKHPMASYLVAIAIGEYKSMKLQQTSTAMEVFYKPEDSTKVEPTYRYTAQIMTFLESELGVAFPWSIYKQVPVEDFLYAGMENTTATFFSQAFVVDSIGFIDRNYVNVNAHEMAHQWFGDLVTETDGFHHWLHEGFATYYALLAEREIFGDDYYYWKLYNTAEQLKDLSEKGKGERLLNEKASSLTYYEKGAWALHILRETMGNNAFRDGITSYLEKFAYQNVTTDDFIAEMQRQTEIDLQIWKKNWLEQTAFKAEEAYNSLVKSSFMKSYFEIAALRNVPIQDKKERLQLALREGNELIGQEAIYQLSETHYEESLPLYEQAMRSKNLMIRQAIALSMDEIPLPFKKNYEQLLNDDSYLTKEAALYNLWINFPEDRIHYLKTTQDIIGFQDRNFRQLWLVLSLHTDSIAGEIKLNYLKELQSYTQPTYSYEIREKAFEYLNSMDLLSDEVLKNLVNACVHHYWRFRDAARELLKAQIGREGVQDRVLAMYADFSTEEKAYLKRTYNIP